MTSRVSSAGTNNRTNLENEEEEEEEEELNESQEKKLRRKMSFQLLKLQVESAKKQNQIQDKQLEKANKLMENLDADLKVKRDFSGVCDAAKDYFKACTTKLDKEDKGNYHFWV